MAKRWVYIISGIDYATGDIDFGVVDTTSPTAMAQALSGPRIAAVFGVPMMLLDPPGATVRHAAMRATTARRCRQRWNRKRRRR